MRVGTLLSAAGDRSVSPGLLLTHRRAPTPPLLLLDPQAAAATISVIC